MFVQVLRKKKHPNPVPPRFIEYPADAKVWEGFKEFPNSTGRHILPVRQKTQPKRYKGARKPVGVISLAKLAANGGPVKQNIERLLIAELETQARRNNNDALAVLLLLAS